MPPRWSEPPPGWRTSGRPPSPTRPRTAWGSHLRRPSCATSPTSPPQWSLPPTPGGRAAAPTRGPTTRSPPRRSADASGTRRQHERGRVARRRGGAAAPAVRRAVAVALEEDLLPLGDLTAVLLAPEAEGSAVFVSRAPGVLAGTSFAVETLRQVGGAQLDLALRDGARLEPGTVIGTVTGSFRSVVTAERTALNFLCHLSGVASLTARYVAAVEAVSPSCRVCDTRKTTPGLRALEKAAVRAGGGANH